MKKKDILLSDLNRRVMNSTFGKYTNICNTYEPIRSGWKKHKGNLVKETKEGYKYI